jgi:hypothetical protein
MVRSEGNMSLKNPVTPPGIDPGTVRLVAQRRNHYATPGLMKNVLFLRNEEIKLKIIKIFLKTKHKLIAMTEKHGKSY